MQPVLRPGVALRLVSLAVVALGLPGYARGAAAVAATDTIWTIAGGGRGGDGLPATLAQIDQPRHVSQALDGSIYVTEPFRNRVRKISPTGVIATFAGTGEAGFSGDGGPARAARLNLPHAAVPLPDGSVLIADSVNYRIRKVLPDGTITTVAGNGLTGLGGDGGPATAAPLNNPRSVAPLPDGGFLIPDSGHHCVRKVDQTGTMTTVAGTCGVSGFAGDSGPATAALLDLPFSAEPLADGSLLIVDALNQRIRKVDASGTITTVAGNGAEGFAGDGGPATSASLSDPHAVFPLPGGGFVIADASAERVRMVGPSGIITTLVGNGVRGFTGDGGPARAAKVSVPKGVWVTRDGYLLIADEQNGRIRAVGRPVAPQASSPPKIAGTPRISARLTASIGSWRASGGKATTLGPAFALQWQRCGARAVRCLDIAGATGFEYVVQPADTGWGLRVRVTASNPAGSAKAHSSLTPLVKGSSTVRLVLAPSSADGSVSRIYSSAGAASAAVVQTQRREVVVARTKAASRTLVSVGLLRFDTSSIPPDARITRVLLEFAVIASGTQEDLRLLVEPYPAFRWPIDRSDFATAPLRTPVAVYHPNWLHGGQLRDIPLLPTAIDTRRPTTAFRLLMSGGPTTRGTNLLRLAAEDHRTLAGPALVVTYESR